MAYGLGSMPHTFELKRQLYLELPHTCHFDRPTGVEKPLYFADVCITKEAKWNSPAYTGSSLVGSKWQWASAVLALKGRGFSPAVKA